MATTNPIEIVPPPVHPKSTDLTGRKFGKWEVLGYSMRGKSLWWCRCVCGVAYERSIATIKNGTSGGCRSCTRKPDSIRRLPEYRIWADMIQRCNNPNHHSYANYGGRGIRVSDRWAASYPAFLADIGRRPTKKHTIERIENNGNYETGNVKWATRHEQNRNHRGNRMVTIGAKTLCISDWARHYKIGLNSVYGRIAKGWDVHKALTFPPRRFAKLCK